jgi:hypothetical protein
MKNTFEIEIINAGRLLSSNELIGLRSRMKSLLDIEGIISLCLEPDTLYVEFNPNLFDLEIFKLLLYDVGFPIKEDIRLASIHLVA